MGEALRSLPAREETAATPSPCQRLTSHRLQLQPPLSHSCLERLLLREEPRHLPGRI